jgi:ADP-ribose pyrophosphatase YjhB (NUDIX family)
MVEKDEILEQALKRELNEEIGIEMLNPKFLTMLKTNAADDVSGTVELYYFLVKEWKGEVVNRSEHFF